MKKLGLLAICSVAVFCLLVACGGKDEVSNSASSGTVGGDSSSSENSTKSQEQITLTYAIWDRNQQPGMEAIAAAFTEKNPHITIEVNVTNWGEYWTKLEASATGGAMPDIFWMHIAQFNMYAEHGMLLDLTGKIPNSLLSNFPEDLVSLYSFDGAQYGVPKDFDTIGVFYNKDLFDAAGVAYPDGDWDWSEFTETARQLTKDGIWGTAAPMDAQQGYWNTMHQAGGFVISEDKKTSGFDDVNSLRGLEWWVGLSLNEKVSPPSRVLEENGFFEMFMAEQIAMVMLGSWMVPGITQNPELVDKIDVVALPYDKEAASIYNGLAYSGSAKTKHKEEVLAFLEFCATEEANLIQAEYASAIPAYKGTADAWIQHVPTWNLQVFVDQLDCGVIYPTSKKGLQWDLLKNDILPAVFAGTKSVEEGGKEYASQMNAILATE